MSTHEFSFFIMDVICKLVYNLLLIFVYRFWTVNVYSIRCTVVWLINVNSCIQTIVFTFFTLREPWITDTLRF